jgi:hypothetical protein
MSVNQQLESSPPLPSVAEPEMPPTQDNDEQPSGRVEAEGTDDQQGKEVPTTAVAIETHAADADHTPTPDEPDDSMDIPRGRFLFVVEKKSDPQSDYFI